MAKHNYKLRSNNFDTACKVAGYLHKCNIEYSVVNTGTYAVFTVKATASEKKVINAFFATLSDGQGLYR